MPLNYDYCVGAAAGFAVTGLFPLVFARAPAAWFMVGTPQHMGWLAVASVAISPPTVYLFQSAMKKLGCTNVKEAMEGGIHGGLMFDGLALSFLPAIYGHKGPAMHGIAASILLAFGCLGISARLMMDNEDTKSLKTD